MLFCVFFLLLSFFPSRTNSGYILLLLLLSRTSFSLVFLPSFFEAVHKCCLMTFVTFTHVSCSYVFSSSFQIPYQIVMSFISDLHQSSVIRHFLLTTSFRVYKERTTTLQWFIDFVTTNSLFFKLPPINNSRSSCKKNIYRFCEQTKNEFSLLLSFSVVKKSFFFWIFPELWFTLMLALVKINHWSKR